MYFDSELENYFVEAIRSNLRSQDRFYLCYKLDDNVRELHLDNIFNISIKNYLPRESTTIVPFVYKKEEFPLIITDIPEEKGCVIPKIALQKSTKNYIKELIEIIILKIQKDEAFESIKKSKFSNYKRGLQRDNLSL